MKKTGKVVVVVQTRMGSTRCPGKVMKEVCNKPMILLMLERLSKAKLVDEIIVATTTKKSDDIIENVVRKNDYNVFRGSEQDCLDRHYQAAKNVSADYVVKITSDCPLIDPEVVDRVIGYFLENKNKYDYVSNVHPTSYPNGFDVEIVHFSVLKQAWKEAKDPYQREMTTTFIHTQPSRFRVGNVSMPNGENLFMSERWTIDYPEDIEFVRKIFENLYQNGRIFLMDEIKKLLEKRKDIWNINHHLVKFNRVH